MKIKASDKFTVKNFPQGEDSIVLCVKIADNPDVDLFLLEGQILEANGEIYKVKRVHGYTKSYYPADRERDKDFLTLVSEKLEHKYEVDDRGNVAHFYDIIDETIVATLDREAGPTADQTTWDGDEEVTKWANANGYNLTCVGKMKT